jgi:3-mercaptopyruvate sulfurtransferase SseA
MNRLAIGAAALSAAIFGALLFAQDKADAPAPAVANPWQATDVVTAANLAHLLTAGGAQPAVFQVGFAILYRSKHIPGSVYAGPGSKHEGLESLKKAALAWSKNQPIVLYCGCCPMAKCPNLRPAFRLLASLGYQHVHILDIPENFTKDWIEKGYPIEAGSAASQP